MKARITKIDSFGKVYLRFIDARDTDGNYLSEHLNSDLMTPDFIDITVLPSPKRLELETHN